jgi:hypothetical protein
VVQIKVTDKKALSTNMLTKRKTAFYLTHVLLLFAQASIALVLLVLAPSEEKNAIFLGYSIEKLLLLSFLFGVFLLGFVLLVRFYSYRIWFLKLDEFLTTKFSSRLRNLTNILSFVFILMGFYLVMALNWESFFVLAPQETGKVIPLNTLSVSSRFRELQFYLHQLKPIIYLVIGLCIQTIIFLVGLQTDFRAWKIRIRNQGLKHILWVYGFFLIIWALLNWGSTHFEPDFEGYSMYPVGAPILDSDVLLSIAIGMVLIGVGVAVNVFGLGTKFFPKAQSNKRDRNIDIVIILIIWLITAVFWLSLPTEPNWFISEPRYPNYEYYPNSDALKHDITGQNMLLGGDLLFSGFVMFKPLYPAFLAFLYAIAGPQFERITLIQSAIFAVFPALVYLITKKIHTRLAGIIAASLIIFREVNAIILSSQITVSHSRQLMTETPAVIGIILIIWMIFGWIEEPNKKILHTLIIGGGIGLLIQVRNELIFLLPVILLFNVFIHYRFPKYWLTTSALLVTGVILFVIPWQIRLVHFSGSPLWIARRANFILNRSEVEPTALPKASQDNPDSKIENQDDVFQQFFGHLVHNQKQAFLIFPAAYRQVDSLIGYSVHGNIKQFWHNCCLAENYIDRLQVFWQWLKWDGNVPKESLLAILTTLFLISVGIVKSREKSGIRALFPLFIVFAYYLLLSVFRISGGRRVQVVDWIWIIYFSIGLSQLFFWVFHFLFFVEIPPWLAGKQKRSDDDFCSRQVIRLPDNPSLNWKSVFSVSLLVFIIGALVPIIEQIIPPRFTEETQEAQINSVILLENGEIIRELLENGGVAQQGKALYPRYYAVGESEPNQNDDKLIQFGHLRFYLAGPYSQKIVLPLTDKHQFELPHYSDVLVVGCEENYLDALAIFVEDENSILFRDPLPEKLVCPISYNISASNSFSE